MSLILVKKINPDGSSDTLLMSSVDKTNHEKAQKVLKVVFPDCECSIVANLYLDEKDILVEQDFNENYGGMALLTSL